MTEKIDAERGAWLNLTGRVCVVTGGGSGIGAETARQLAAVGAFVAILDRDGQGAARVAAEIETAGGRAISIAADVTQREAMIAAATEVERALGRCDILINNAALQYGGALMTLDLDKWNQAIAVNLTGALICVQVFGQQMIAGQRGGSIVNVASLAGEHPRANGGAYSVSKAGMMMLSRQLTLELAEHRIRSNVVAPGFVNTPLSEKIYQNPEVAHQRTQIVPSGRIGEPRDMADAIIFLSSDRSSYINGQTLVVDGGLGHTLMSLVPRA